MATLLILPGLGGSGPEHWQTKWEELLPGAKRVEQENWDKPDRDAWIAALEAAVVEAPGPVVLIAHSLACALVDQWAATGTTSKVYGALLVAPADVDDETRTPPEAQCFAPLNLNMLPFRTIVVASTDDPYIDPDRAQYYAACWYGGFLDIGPCGHVNAESGLGDWPEGRDILSNILPSGDA